MQILIPLLIMSAVVASIAALFVISSACLGPKKPSSTKDEPFECGIRSEGLARQPVPVRYYVMALLFIVFDVELAFLFPWAVVFRELGIAGLVEMFVFFLVAGAGYVYAWKIGALEWE